MAYYASVSGKSVMFYSDSFSCEKENTEFETIVNITRNHSCNVPKHGNPHIYGKCFDYPNAHWKPHNLNSFFENQL